jgi:undecaprenyl-diphosphatase
MPLWFAAFLGLVQGLTEFLPISSTAHLRIAPALLGQADPGAAYTAVIQLGTLLAVVTYFARDLFVTMPRALLTDVKSAEARLALYLIAGNVPIVASGLLFKNYITGPLRSLWVVAAALGLVGLVMLLADRRKMLERTMESIVLRDALIIGGAQAMALIPGVSRSGSTIVAALCLGLRRPDAARFSFLLGVPAIAGAGIFELRDAAQALGGSAWLAISVGTFVAAVSGYATISWLLRYLGRHTLAPFAGYRIALAVLLVALCATGVVDPSEP